MLDNITEHGLLVITQSIEFCRELSVTKQEMNKKIHWNQHTDSPNMFELLAENSKKDLSYWIHIWNKEIQVTARFLIHTIQ